MKTLIVYGVGDRWFGSEVSWKRSGSGSYRETTTIDVPQTREQIAEFAEKNGFLIEWRKPLPDAQPAASARSA